MSPRSKAQFEEIREASTKKILSAALDLFGTVGYEATSIAQIAKKAEVSKGLVYNYFDSKEDLLQAVVMDLVNMGDEIVKNMFDPDPAKTLENLIRSVFDWLSKNDRLNRLLVSLSTQLDRFQFVREMANGKMEGYLIMLEDLLHQLNFPDAKTEARILATFFDGIALHVMMMKEDYPLMEVQDMLINKYCKTPINK